MIPILGQSLYGPESGPGGIALAGTHVLEPDRWQTLTVPTRYGYWDTVGDQIVADGSTPATVENYIIAQLEDVYGAGVVEVARSRPGDVNKWLNYVPGSTPTASEHNFALAYMDGAQIEFAAILIRSLHNVDMDLIWETDIG